MKSFCVKAPVKINFFLHIVGKEKTGYHSIESLFVFANLSNFLEIKIDKKNFKYETSIVRFIKSERKINSRQNSIMKAVNMLLKYAPAQTKVIVKVVKNIPISSGLGSGSADAGAIIRTLGNLWKINRSILNKIALSIGTDVPASIDSNPVLVKGIGDELYPIERLPLPKDIVLVKPKKRFLSTIEVFSKYKKDNFSKPIKWIENSGQKDLLDFLKESKNDLQEIATSIIPEIRDIISTLESQKGSILSRMSGSGVACFAIFDNEENAKIAAINMKENRPEWWICNTKLII